MSPKSSIFYQSVLLMLLAAAPLFSDNELVPLWKYAAGGVLVSPPAVSGSGVYLYSEDRQIHAVSTKGEPLWKFRMPGRPSDTLSVGHDGTVYACTLDGRMFAVNQAGRALWRFEADGEPAGAPAVSADGTVYLALKTGELSAVSHTGFTRWKINSENGISGVPVIDSGNAVYFADDAGSVYCYSPWGTEKWVLESEQKTAGAEWIAAIDQHILYSGFDRRLQAVEKGEIIWSRAMPADLTGIVIFPDGLFCSFSDGTCSAYDREGNELWTAEGGGYYSYPVAGGKRIFMLNRSGLVSIDFSGKIEGSGRVDAIRLTQPVMGGGLLVCGSEQWVACAFNVSDEIGAGWSQKGGGPAHSGTSGSKRWYFDEAEYLRNMDYLYLKQYITSGSTDEKLDAVEEIGNRIAAEGIDRGEQYLLHLLHMALTEGNIRRIISEGSRSNDYPAIRREAARLIGLYGNFESIELLTAVLAEEEHYDVSAAIIAALGELGADYNSLPQIAIYNKVIKDNNGSAYGGLALAAIGAVAKISEYTGVPGSGYGY
ncbi:MAG TPA: hypothetical protein DCO79_16145, partial [Spirochaeta sp.]|nr:hypothetical protein [Spirochaeta sp.]